MDPVITHPTEGESLKIWETDCGSINLSCSSTLAELQTNDKERDEERMIDFTGTFFCDSTTAQFFPRTPTEVILAAVMALKAYSEVANADVNIVCALSRDV